MSFMLYGEMYVFSSLIGSENMLSTGSGDEMRGY